VTALIDDFKELTIHSGGRKKTKKLVNQNKGQKEEVSLFINGLLKGKDSLIPFDQLYTTSLATFGVLESLRNGTVVSLTTELS
jgi:polar amino acid transport system substrate-binding protein